MKDEVAEQYFNVFCEGKRIEEEIILLNYNFLYTRLMKRILVTGGAGFVGSHLCARLLKEGHSVICLDNFFTGRNENISYLKSLPGFEVLERDITSSFHVKGPIDEIYNLACPASPVHYQCDPIKTLKTSVVGAINVLELALRKKSKVLQASTSEVYGDPIVHPQLEGYWGNVNPVGIRSCYDEGKRCAETLFMDYHRERQARIKIVRIFNTYGPNMLQNDGRVVSNFVVQALKGEDITIYGTGAQTRSFQYIDDLIEGMIKMMNSKEELIGPVNIGNPVEFRIKDLAEMVISLVDSPSRIVYKPLPGDDPRQRKPDITLAIKELDWQPQVSLKDGLVHVIDYFRKEIHADNELKRKYA